MAAVQRSAYSDAVNPPEDTSSWPANLLRQQPVGRVYVCGQQLEPPPLSHVVNFPRLEVPLKGCYENQIESSQGVVTVQLRPGDALFAPPNCWNQPTWRYPVRLMSLLLGKKQLGVSIVTTNGTASPGLMAQKFSQPRPLTGPVPRIMEAMFDMCDENVERFADSDW